MRAPDGYPDVGAEAASIREAVADSRPGDVVVLHDGLYEGADNSNIRFPDFALTVRSLNGPSDCTIDLRGRRRTRAFLFDGLQTAAGARVEGLTIINGNHDLGGAIFCSADGESGRASPTIERCVFRACRATRAGGAVYLRGGAAPLMIACEFTANLSGGDGGAVAVDGPGVEGTVVTPAETARLRGCRLTANRAQRRGGALWIRTSVVTLEGCTLSENSARMGGGLACQESGTPRCESTVIGNNAASMDGGGLWIDSATPSLRLCTVENNVAGRDGGGVWARDSRHTVVPDSDPPPMWGPTPPQFDGSIVRDNRAGANGRGGGIFVDNLDLGGTSGFIFNHGFIVDNTAATGGGIFLLRGRAYLNNSVINTNTAVRPFGVGGAAVVGSAAAWLGLQFCTVHGNAAGTDMTRGEGAGIFVFGVFDWDPSFNAVEPGELVVANSIIHGNLGNDSGLASQMGRARDRRGRPVGRINVGHSCIEFGAGIGPFTISTNPRLLAGRDGIRYLLPVDSPCVDAAHAFRQSVPPALPCCNERTRPCADEPTAPFLPWARDIEGGWRKVRVVAGDTSRPLVDRAYDVAYTVGADMGAYEVQAAPGADLNAEACPHF